MSEAKTKIYLCHPYSHPDPVVMQLRFQSANELAARLMRCGFVVFSPLSHSVPIADHLKNHRSYDFWLGQELAWLRLCDEVWVPLVEGWADSRGIEIELVHASELGKRIVYFAPNEGDGYRVCSDQEVRQSMVKTKAEPAEAPGDGGLSELYP